jgi:phosphonate transport system substrate-binding protein
MEEYMSKAKRSLFLCLAIMLIATVAVTACAPAATPTEAPTAEPAKPVATAVPPTKAPTVAPTAIPAKCDKMANPPVVKAGEWGSPDKPIVITYVPSGDTGKITKAGTAIADCVSKITGLSIKIEVGTSMGGSIEAMGAQKAQIGFLNTFSVMLARAKYQVIPALAVVRKYATPDGYPDPDAALKGTPQDFYKAEFLTKTTSGINTLADLKGKTFCFVEPNSTSGYVVPNIILKANGIDPEKDFKNVIMAGGHDKVAIAVYKGDCDAGVTFVDTRTDASYKLYETYKDIGTVLKVFYLSDRLPNDGIQYIKELDPKVQVELTYAFTVMSADPGGKQILKALYNVDLYKIIEPTYYDAFTAALKKAGVDPAALVK